MALLPETQDDQLKFLGILVLCGAAALYWLYVLQPRQEELALREDSLSQIQFENRRAEARVGALEEIRRELEAYEARLGRLIRLIPEREEVPALYESIASRSQSLGVELVSVNPREVAADSTQHFLRQRWTMSVEGEYHRLGRFLSDVASLERLVRPTVQEITPVETGDGAAVRAQLELEAFVIPPDTAGTAGAGAGG